MEMAFREFRRFPVTQANQIVGNVPVKNGAVASVPATPAAAVAVTMQVDSHAGMKTALQVDSNLTAPLRQGQRVGSLVITAPDFPPLSVPVYAAQAVAKENMFMGLWHRATGAFGKK